MASSSNLIDSIGGEITVNSQVASFEPSKLVAFIVTVPGFLAVIRPSEDTVAIDLSLLSQVIFLFSA